VDEKGSLLPPPVFPKKLCFSLKKTIFNILGFFLQKKLAQSWEKVLHISAAASAHSPFSSAYTMPGMCVVFCCCCTLYHLLQQPTLNKNAFATIITVARK
jgi:hypothetical protein